MHVIVPVMPFQFGFNSAFLMFYLIPINDYQEHNAMFTQGRCIHAIVKFMYVCYLSRDVYRLFYTIVIIHPIIIIPLVLIILKHCH